MTISILYTSLTDRQKSINQFKMYIVLPILPLGLVHFISINSRSSLFQGTLVRGYNEITWLVLIIVTVIPVVIVKICCFSWLSDYDKEYFPVLGQNLCVADIICYVNMVSHTYVHYSFTVFTISF